MKKLLSLVIVCLLATVAFAQPGNGDGRAKMREMMKQKLVTDLGVTDAIADSVMSVQMTYMMKNRELRRDTSAAGKENMKASMAERNAKLKAFLSDDQIKKLEAIEAEQRKQMMERRTQMGGGNPPPPPPPPGGN